MKIAYWMSLPALLALFILLTGWAVSPTHGQPVTTRPPSAWEYKTLNQHANNPGGEGQLNDLGKEGWELVSVACIPEGPSSASPSLHYVFQRAK